MGFSSAICRILQRPSGPGAQGFVLILLLAQGSIISPGRGTGEGCSLLSITPEGCGRAGERSQARAPSNPVSRADTTAGDTAGYTLHLLLV